jgi:hypothetical protein
MQLRQIRWTRRVARSLRAGFEGASPDMTSALVNVAYAHKQLSPPHSFYRFSTVQHRRSPPNPIARHFARNS